MKIYDRKKVQSWLGTDKARRQGNRIVIRKGKARRKFLILKPCDKGYRISGEFQR